MLKGFKASHLNSNSWFICSSFLVLFYKISLALEFLREFLYVVALEVIGKVCYRLDAFQLILIFVVFVNRLGLWAGVKFCLRKPVFSNKKIYLFISLGLRL